MKKIIIFLLIVISTPNINAQDALKKIDIKKPLKSKLSLAVNISETKNAFNFVKVIGQENAITKSIHPRINATIEYDWKKNYKIRKYTYAEFGYHNFNFVEKVIDLHVGFNIEHSIYKRFYSGYGLALGFGKATRADVVYELENGVWQSKLFPANWLYNRQFVRGNLELGYRFKNIPLDVNASTNLEVIRHYYGKEIPFNLNKSMLRVGARWHL